MNRQEEPLKEFAEELKRWSGRPTSYPPDEASRRLQARLAAPRHPLLRNPRIALVGMLVAAVLGGYWIRKDAVPVSSGPGADASIVLRDDQLLLWLDEQTPLYLSLESSGD